MTEIICKSLENGIPIIIPCDLFYLPYSKSYLDLHKRHYIIVKGIDLEKGILYVLDNMHNDLGASTEYTDFMLEIDRVYIMSKTFLKEFDEISSKTYLWTINMEYSEYKFEIMNQYSEKLFNNLIKTINYLELDIITSSKIIKMNEYLEFAKMRKVFLTSIKNIYSNHNLEEEINKVIKKWEEIKIKIMFLMENGSGNIDILEYEINENILNEKSIFSSICENEFKSNIEIYKKPIKKSSITKLYQIINKNNAPIEIDECKISICLDDNKLYDIWNNSDNGVIVLFNMEKSNLDIEMKLDTELGSSSQCGICIQLEDKSKILFGSLGGLNMAIHVLDGREKYEEYINPYIVKDNTRLYVETKDNIVYFYVANEERSVHSMKLKSNISSIGIFAKTWEYSKCNVRFEIVKIR